MRGAGTITITFVAIMAAGMGTAAAGSPQLRCSHGGEHPQAVRSLAVVHAPAPTLTATVYDYVGVGEENIAGVEQIVDAIYRSAGVAIRWLSACDISRPIGLTVNLLGKSAVHEVMREDALGFADYQSVTANVLYDRVITAASVTKFRPAPVIGCVMAHELGHLLLGPGSHSSDGIMRPGFNPASRCWSESFSRQQAARIARAVAGVAVAAAAEVRETSEFQSLPKDSPAMPFE